MAAPDELRSAFLATEDEQSPATRLASFRRKVRELPDLTSRLMEQGIHGEYVAWRDQYMRWRQGEARGAKGENTVVGHAKRCHSFEEWYPTMKTFNFRRTITFWVAVTCVEGCLLFLWIPFYEAYGIRKEDMHYELTKVPNLVGGTFFLTGIYLGYFELINLDSERINTNNFNFFWCDWQALLKLDIEPCSIVGSSSYLIGALWYTLSQVSDLFDLGEVWHARLVDWPLVIGGFLFFTAGVCELLINRVFTRLPTAYVWWVALLNAIGGVSFWLSACPSVADGKTLTLIGVVGTVCYIVAAILSLLMWRGEQFGGGIIPALNRAVDVPVTLRRDPKTGVCQVIASSVAPDDLENVLNPKLSWRGLIFLNVYAAIGAAQVIACATCLGLEKDYRVDPRDFRRSLNVLISGLGNMVIVHMVLVLNSACVTMPKKGEEPYRTLMIVMRVLALLILANSLLTLEVQFDF